MQDSSSSRNSNDSIPLLLGLVCSIVINLGQYAIANDAIRNLELQVYKANTEINVCEGRFQGFVEGRR